MTLLTTELLPTKSYPFQTLRYLFGHLANVQEGVATATDLVVVPRGAGANMSVDVGAGAAWIQGDDTARQGLYHQINDATVNVPIAAADPTNPRVDQVYLQANDSSIVGVSDTPTLAVVAGTPTVGATLDNRLGVAAFPNTAIRLADVLVGAGATSIVTAAIRDRRLGAPCVIPATESRTNTAYGLLPTADQVDVVLPTNGKIVIAYKATWQESVTSAGAAAIFIGPNQLKVPQSSGSIGVQQASIGASPASNDNHLTTSPLGLISGANTTPSGADVTTGEAIGITGVTGVGGPCYVFAAAGTYTISVQFKASSGSVTVKNRKLWAWVEGR